jgi:hypothetical protein
MPQIIPHPETLRRETQRDVFFIGEFPDRTKTDPERARSRFTFPPVLENWLTLHMPDVRWGKTGPRELSGWLLGGPVYYYLTFSAEQALQYEAHWERPDPDDRLGRERDAAAGFRCYCLPFQPWRERLDTCVVNRGMFAPIQY